MWHQQANLTNIPILFLEFGYPSHNHGLLTTWLLIPTECAKQENQGLQAAAYDYFLQFFMLNSIQPLQKYWSLINGLLFFQWSLPGIDYEGEPQYPCGWNPREKLAEKIFIKYLN